MKRSAASVGFTDFNCAFEALFYTSFASNTHSYTYMHTDINAPKHYRMVCFNLKSNIVDLYPANNKIILLSIHVFFP